MIASADRTSAGVVAKGPSAVTSTPSISGDRARDQRIAQSLGIWRRSMGDDEQALPGH